MRTVPLSVSMTVLWGQIPLVTKCLQAAENIWKIWFVTRLGVKARSVELNVSQRCSASLISAADQKEAVSAGRFGIHGCFKWRNRQNGLFCPPSG